ncbi:MAG: aminotransferase class V-fold PLP-dependent enzyme, partial [Halobacteriovoraceae bacterium]|nr:aminotransferase class V-fold PLP-dependent enzyme [Halobacteriovoraceae bacterium]
VPTRNGHFTPEDLIEKVTDQTAAVVASTVQFLTGLRLDLQKLSQLADEKKVPLILNSTQSLGAFPLDLSQLKVAALSSSCHKWLGAGIGQAILFLSTEFKKGRKYPLVGWCSVDEPFEMRNEPPQMREDTAALMLGSLPFAAIAGVVEACKVQEKIGREAIAQRLLELSGFLRTELVKRNLHPLGPKTEKEESPIVTFPFSQADLFVEFLTKKDIHVNQRRGKVRVSPHFYNTEEDLKTFLEALDEFLKLRTSSDSQRL